MKTEGGFLVAKVHQLSGRVFNQLLRDSGIEFNSSQGRILFVLWKEDNVPIKKLSQETQLSKSTLTSMLERLESSGHILRLPSEQDRRVTYVRLTEKNKELKQRYEEISETMTQLYYRGFSGEEIIEFEDYLRRILDNLKDV